MPLVTVEAAIADGQARPGIRDLAGWVVSLLRTHRDYGWTITPPAPAPDSPESLSDAFARYAAEQDAARCLEPDRLEQPLDCVEQDDLRPMGVIPSPQPLVQLWNDMQAAMRMRLTRQEFNTWIRPANLRSVAHGMATISAPSVRVKEGLEQRYTAALGDLITTLLDTPTRVRVIVHDELPVTQAQSEAECANHSATKAAKTTVDRKIPPESAPEYRPDWISANQWGTLPAMLRAALVGSIVTNGALQAISPHLTQLIATRYAREVAALGLELHAHFNCRLGTGHDRA